MSGYMPPSESHRDPWWAVPAAFLLFACFFAPSAALIVVGFLTGDWPWFAASLVCTGVLMVVFSR